MAHPLRVAVSVALHPVTALHAAAPPARYREHAPPPALAALVDCFWERAASATPVAGPPGRVLPDGAVDLILSVDERAAGGARHACYLVGTMTRPLVVPSQPGVAHAAVRLRPGAARALLGVDAAELTDQRVPLEQLWPDGAALLDALHRRVAPRELVHRLVARRLRGADAPPPLVRAAVRALERSGGQLDVATLCTRLGVTRQHLGRQFARHVGVAPKLLARIVRVRRVTEAAERAREPEWSRLALDAGFCDQSHLVHDFGALVGLTPERWLAERRRLVPFLQDAGQAAR